MRSGIGKDNRELSPIGSVYQAGTMSGNPVVMVASYAALTKLHANPAYYDHLEKLGSMLEKGILEITKEKEIKALVNRHGAMLTVFFTEKEEVKNYADARTCDTKLFVRYFEHMLNGGINIEILRGWHLGTLGYSGIWEPAS